MYTYEKACLLKTPLYSLPPQMISMSNTELIIYFALFILMISNVLTKLPCILLSKIYLEVLLNQTLSVLKTMFSESLKNTCPWYFGTFYKLLTSSKYSN